MEHDSPEFALAYADACAKLLAVVAEFERVTDHNVADISLARIYPGERRQANISWRMTDAELAREPLWDWR